MNVFVSVSICVSCTFLLALFSICLIVLFWFVSVLSYFILFFSLDDCFLSRVGKASGFELEGKNC